jgi:hypothetical protein
LLNRTYYCNTSKSSCLTPCLGKARSCLCI